MMDWMNPESISTRRSVRTKIIVISLPAAQERRERFRERAHNAPVAWSFYPGRTGLHPRLHYDEQAAIIAKGRPLRPGELGCFSSHSAIASALSMSRVGWTTSATRWNGSSDTVAHDRGSWDPAAKLVF